MTRTCSTNNGAEVSEVPSGTPASDAGLKKGDVVTGVDGKPVTDGIGLIVAIRSHQPGETISLTVQRDGDEIKVDVTLEVQRSGQDKRVEVTLDGKVG